MLKKLRNSLVVLFLLGAIVLPLSQSKGVSNSTNTQNTISTFSVPRDMHDIN